MLKEHIRRVIEWKRSHAPSWWPERLCLTNPIVMGVVTGLILGGGVSWWANTPTARWMEFSWLTASYRLGTLEIHLNGEYAVRRECWRNGGQVIWRTEAIATDGQIALYGPAEETPLLTVGEHDYDGSIKLLENIDPDGWVVRVIVTCPSETPETVASPAARVIIEKASWP